MAVSKTLIWDNIDQVMSFNHKMIGATSGGRLWSVAIHSTTPRAKYSDDNGSSWSSFEAIFISEYYYPDIFIDQNDALHCVTSRSVHQNSPIWNRRNGSWLGSENVRSDAGGGHNYGNIVVTSGNQPFCFWVDQGANPITINNKQRAGGGGWSSEYTTNITAGWTVWPVCACIDDNNLMHIAWMEVELADTNHRKIKTCTFNGSSFSSHIEHDEVTNGHMQLPVFRHMQGTELWLLWSRDGIGVETSYYQVKYKIYDGSWATEVVLTDTAGDHKYYDVGYNNTDDVVVVVYSEVGADPNNPTKHNIISQTYNPTGEVWSDTELLTEENQNVVTPNITFISGVAHISFWLWDGSNYDIYHGSYTPTVPTTAKEIYDYVSTIAADVDQTLSLDPQVVIPEVGGKGDVIHLADDDSEERCGFSDDFTFFITIRFDLLNQVDAGTLLDLWADSSKANGRINSFKFSHPDGHTYVVRFDTDMTRLMAPTYYGVKNIRLKVLGRIAD